MTVSRKKAQASLEKVTKGYRVVDDPDEDAGDAADQPLDVDDTTPAVEDLRRKYLSDDYYDDAGSDSPAPRRRNRASSAATTFDLEHDNASTTADDDEDESGLVKIKPEAEGDPHDGSTRERTAVVSKKGKVIGLQG